MSMLTGIISAVKQSEKLVRSILNVALGDNRANPYVSLGFVGLEYLIELLNTDGSAEQMQAVLARSPSELWAEAGNVEMRVALIKQAQLDLVGKR